MHTIDLTYVGRGLHEELIAYVADQQGYFEDEGVHVAIRDGITWKNEHLRGGATIGLGRALLSRLTDGIQWNVLCANTHRPLFWFIGRGEVKSMDDLRGRRLAVHPPRTAPGCFARIVLRRHGLDPDRDLECVARAPGDYQMHVRQVTTRWICGAFATVRLMPPLWAAHWHPSKSRARRAFRFCAGWATTSRSPTVGIAVDPARIQLDNPALHALVQANKRALRTIAERPELAVDYIALFLDRLTRDEVQRYHERYIGPYFTSDGRVDRNVAQQAVDAVATELSVARASVDQMYQSAI